MKVAKFIMIGITIITFLVMLGNFLIGKAFREGETHEGLRKNIAQEQIIHIKAALEKYKEKKAHYPVTNSKYFLDSLINLVTVEKIYLYRDSIINNRIVHSYNVEKITQYTNNLFVGIGNSNHIIKYSCEDGINYKIYFIE